MASQRVGVEPHRLCDPALLAKVAILIVAAATFRAPAAMPWADFWNGLFVPYHEEDPDFDAAKGWEQFDWFLAVNREEHPVTIDPARTLSELGVTHKGVLGFRTRA